MLSLLAHLVVSAALLLLVSQIIDGIRVEGAGAALLAALVLGLVNAVVRPIAVLLTLPLTILTFGLFLLVVNAFMLQLTALLVPGFEVRGFGAAFWGSVLFALLNLLVSRLTAPGW